MASAAFPKGFCLTRLAVPLTMISSLEEEDAPLLLFGVYVLQSAFSRTDARSSASRSRVLLVVAALN